MKVKIGAIEVTDVTADELDQLIKKYGQLAESPAKTLPVKSKLATGENADFVVLEKLVNAPEGVPTRELGELLGKKGRGVRPALTVWAKRIGLLKEGDDDEIFEQTRHEILRGWRLSEAVIPAAKELLDRK